MTPAILEDTITTEETAKEYYELLYIIPMKFSIEELESIYQKVRDIIKEHQGVITHEELFKKQRLAYRMRHINYGYISHGYYILVEFNILPQTLPLINHDLTLTTEVLRHMIIKPEVLTEEEQKRQAFIRTKLAQKEATERTQMTKPAILAVEPEKSSPVPPQSSPTQPEEKPVLQHLAASETKQGKERRKKGEEQAPSREEKEGKSKDTIEPTPEKSKKAAKPQKLSLEELDKKLDEILDKDTFI